MKIAYCTIASANYLARVQVLENSLKGFHPDAEFHILLCERPEVCRRIASQINRNLLSPADIDCPNWLHMAFYYDITEYNTALKPFLIEKLFKEGYDAILYFDPDIEIYGSLEGLERLAASHDVVLTPHVCTPLYDDRKHPNMEAFIRGGQFNLGFLGIANSPDARELLRWWQSVLEEKCIFDHSLQYFVDQFWAAAFPSFVGNACILRDQAYNMAYWNVYQRKLDHVGGKWLTDGGEVKFFHYSGLSRDDLTRVSVHQNRVTAEKKSPLYKLLEEYFVKIKEQEWASFSSHPYTFATYENGEPISNDERKIFLAMSRAERDEIGDPFAANNLPANVIRLRYRDIFRHDDTKPFYNGSGTKDKAISDLEKLREDMLNSLSWKVTAPLRSVHSILKRWKVL